MGKEKKRGLWFIPTSKHLALLVLLWAPACQPPTEHAAVRGTLPGPLVHPGRPACDNRPTLVSASSWGTKQASAEQKSPRDVAHWAPVRSCSSLWS